MWKQRDKPTYLAWPGFLVVKRVALTLRVVFGDALDSFQHNPLSFVSQTIFLLKSAFEDGSLEDFGGSAVPDSWTERTTLMKN